MRKLIALTTLALALDAGVLQAQSYTHYRVGNFDYWNGPNGYQGTGYKVGNQYYYNDSYGQGNGYSVGGFDYYNYTPNYRYRPQ